MELWTDKHRPRSLEELAGQQKAAAELLTALKRWKRGRAVLLAGPPGCGKTALAELGARELGLELFALNASDQRTAKQLETLGPMVRARPLFGKGRLIVIDEIEGLSGTSDRGGPGAIGELIEHSHFPIVLVADDLWDPKLRALKARCSVVQLGKVPAPSVERQLREICKREGLAAPEGLLKGLARWSNGDLRSAINDLQLLAVGRAELTEADAAALGSRERPRSIAEVLPALFRSNSLAAARRALQEVDAGEALLWAAENLPRERTEIAEAYALLAASDVFLNRVRRQQHWRFKAFASDLLAGIAVSGEGSGFVKYRLPERIALLGASRAQRAEREAAERALGARLHCSARKAREQMPLLRSAGLI